MIAYLASLLIARNPALTVAYARRLVKAGLIAAAILIAGVVFVVWLNGVESSAEERGGAKQREADLRETINRVETANEVRETIRRDSNAAYDECLQSARTPANCVGLLPADKAD